MANNSEARMAGRWQALPVRASETVFVGTIDSSENSTDPRIIQRLSQRFGVSPEVAALVAELSGLGSREARR